MKNQDLTQKIIFPILGGRRVPPPPHPLDPPLDRVVYLIRIEQPANTLSDGCNMYKKRGFMSVQKCVLKFLFTGYNAQNTNVSAI